MVKIIPLLAIFTTLIPLQASASPFLHQPSKFLQAQTQQPNDDYDSLLLIESLQDFLQYDSYKTQSYLQANGESPGVEFKIYAQITTIVSSSGKFRSEILFGRLGGLPGNRYEVISNGEDVWIYEPEQQIYQVTDYESFNDSSDYALIGLSSILYLKIPPSARSFFREGADSKIIEQILASGALSSEAITIEGKQYISYGFQEQSSGLGFAVIVDPVSKTVKQVDFEEFSAKSNIQATEQISSRVANPPVTSDTFNFVPTEEMTEVEEIKINPI